MKKQLIGFLLRGKHFKSSTLLALALLLIHTGYSQHTKGPSKKIGTATDFKQKVHPAPSNGRISSERSLPTSDAAIAARMNVTKKDGNGDVVIGEVIGKKASLVSFTINGNNVDGQVVIPQDKKAYDYYTGDDGNVYVQEVNIHDVICIDYENAEQASATTGDQVLAVPPSTSSVYKLQSFPGATAVAYLDFDGEVVSGTRWNGGNTIDAQPGNFTEANIIAIFNLISEDYRPFNVNITTDLAVYNAAPTNKRINCVFTPTNTAAPGSGGVAYLNSFTDSRPNEPCWVFNSGVKSAAEAGSHEIGHTLGLSHDGTTAHDAVAAQDYYAGHGIWGPIMGATYSRALVHWSKGEYPYASQTQDDITIISGKLTFRTDEAGNTIAAAKALVVGTGGAVNGPSNYGIITQRTDIDVYSFTCSAGTINLTVNPAPAYPNLDVLLTLTDGAGTVVATVNPTASGSGTSATALTGLNATLSQTVAAGTYYLHIDGTGQGDLTTGYSDYGSLGEYTISGTIPAGGNQLPTVSITAPANNASYTAPASITINATASDPDGTIAKVEFYQGSTKLGEDASSPYSFSWTSVPQGTYTVTAVAYDNQGLTRTSSPVTVIVNSNTAPSVSITAPANNATYTAPATFTITASASDAGGSIAKVEFFNGATKLGEDATSPYSFNWTGVAAGTYTLTAVATDNGGLTKTSSPITVTVTSPGNQAPAVSITSPANNATYVAPASITISATASDTDGSVALVEFFNGSTKLGEDATSPYSFTWNSVTAGTYTITAVATDNLGLSKTSTAITVVVTANQAPSVSITAPANNATYIAPANIAITATASDADGSVTKVEFFNGATKLGEDASSPYSFTWASVAAGTYTITAVATDNLGLTKTSTAITVVVNANQVPSVSITAPANNATYIAPATIAISATASDADGSVTKVEFFNGTTKLGEDATSPYSFSWTSVAAGTYTLTAVATDNLGLTKTSAAVTVKVNANQPPTITITSPASGSTFTAPATIAFTATATDADGSVAKVEFLNGATKLGEDATSPYTYSWSSVSAGTYTITARATDNLGATSTTSVTVTVENPNQSPTVEIISPADHSVEQGPTTISITAIASDMDGSVTKVEFFNGGTKLGEDATAPYSFTWTNVTPGTYDIIVKATDNKGQTVTAVHTIDVISVTALSKGTTGSAIPLHPNPTTGVFYLDDQKVKPETIKILDAKGDEIKTINNPGTTVDISDLNAGIYVVLLIEGTFTTHVRIVKQ